MKRNLSREIQEAAKTNSSLAKAAVAGSPTKAETRPRREEDEERTSEGQYCPRPRNKLGSELPSSWWETKRLGAREMGNEIGKEGGANDDGNEEQKS